MSRERPLRVIAPPLVPALLCLLIHHGVQSPDSRSHELGHPAMVDQVLKTPETVIQNAFVGLGFCMRVFMHLHKCVHMPGHAKTHVEIKEQLLGAGSLLLPWVLKGKLG